MTVQTIDPAAKSIEDVFAAAMDGPNKPREVPSPADIDPDAPHGRDDAGQPLAPFGLRKDGKPKLSAAGRKSAEDKARVITPSSVSKPADQPKTTAAAGPRDFSAGLADTSESVWVGLSMLSMVPLERTPVIGKLPVGKGKKLGDYLAGLNDRIAAQAHIFNVNRGALVQALNIAANNSARARRLAEKLEDGDVGWAIMCGSLVMPFLSQSTALWSDGGLVGAQQVTEEDGTVSMVNTHVSAAQLAAANKATMDGWIARFNAQLEAATAAAHAEAAAQNGQVQ